MNRSTVLCLIIAAGALSCHREPEGPRVLVPAVSVAPESTPEAAAELEKRCGELGADFVSGRTGPFLILGNCGQEELERIRKWTLQGCADALNKDFFDTKPTGVYWVYLFKDDATYRHFAEKLWNDTDVSRFGYYRSADKTLVMNIGTGTGTLVHEMVHALMDPDFPDPPTWFSEGMGSLFEQCGLNDRGSLRGLINWRFPAVRNALDDGSILKLPDLFGKSRSEFYGDGSGLHYAMARYLCMYAQEWELLPAFYKKFRAGCAADPTGRKTLEAVFGKDLDGIERDWHAWLRTLKRD